MRARVPVQRRCDDGPEPVYYGMLPEGFESDYALTARKQDEAPGLRLRERWGGWNGEPFTAASWRHVSVYERAD